jgi:hypothetical protein
MFAKPGILLRIEGAALFALCLYCYRLTGAGWGLFLLLFLWPDFFMLGYLAHVRLGATLYNLVHIEALPVLLVGFAYAQHRGALLAFVLIWLAHIALDRALGLGLKYPRFSKTLICRGWRPAGSGSRMPPASDSCSDQVRQRTRSVYNASLLC